MIKLDNYQSSRSHTILQFNRVDIIVSIILFGILAAIATGASHMTSPYNVGQTLEISLSPTALPGYALSTVLRMFIALFFSLFFTFLVAPLAAKNRYAEQIIVPMIDIMQSLPVLGMQAITVVGFIHLFPGSQLGPEFASIFAIFISQVWNMVLSLYQSIKTIPKDLCEAAKVYKLSAWQKFWKIELPFATPALLWNIMMSMSAGWFFVVLSEAIDVANQEILLPGIGSYIKIAILKADLFAMAYAFIAMLIVILLYDQLLFRPLLTWAEKFKEELEEDSVYYDSWFFRLLAQTKLLKKIEYLFDIFNDYFVNGHSLVTSNNVNNLYNRFTISPVIIKTLQIIWYSSLALLFSLTFWYIFELLHHKVPLMEVLEVFLLGFITAIKVIVLIIIASIIWVPIGVWIGLSPKATAFFQPIIQILAAFPANFFYPLAVIFIVKYDLNSNIWTMPLMILGTQWYILFNVISSASNLSKDFKLVSKNFHIKGILWWKKIMLPAIFPCYITGAMTAAGGCWNASIVAELVEWGDKVVTSYGLGYYITYFTRVGDFPRIALGISVMCFYVLIFNRLLWQKLYALAEIRCKIS